MQEALTSLPERIRQRIERQKSEIHQIFDAASALLVTQLPGPVSLRFQHSAPTPDVITDDERAQSLSFIIRYEHLPEEYRVQVIEREGDYYIGNLPFLRHALNDFRPLIQNKTDSVFYRNIHRTWYPMLARESPTEGLTFRVSTADGTDVTSIFMKWLGEHNKAISFVMKALDYDYLYNGILQHSDTVYTHRFWEDYTSGELNYILWKHTHMLGFIKEMLRPYYLIANTHTFPRLGPL